MKAVANRLPKPFTLIRFPVKTVAFTILVACMTVGLYSTADASSTAVYYAVYCTNSSNLSLDSNQDSVLGCSGSGSSPSVEAKVSSANSNPKGAHAVTIVEADCYPGTPQSLSPSTGDVSCSEGPDATLTLGTHFPAAIKLLSKPAKKPPAAKPAKVSTPPSSTGAQSPICPNQSSTGRNTCNLPQVAADTGPNGTLHTILQVFFGIIGAFALLMMTASGFKYITAAGNPQKVSEAKSGVIYALVGLMLAVTAEAIVAFVIHWGAPS